MFDKGHWPIIMKSVLESADSALKSGDSSSDSSTDQVKSWCVGMGLYVKT